MKKHTKQNSFKTKWLFLRMIWRVLTNKEQGWLFFKLESPQQESFLKNESSVEINVRFLGVDERVVEKIVNRLEVDASIKVGVPIIRAAYKAGYEQRIIDQLIEASEGRLTSSAYNEDRLNELTDKYVNNLLN